MGRPDNDGDDTGECGPCARGGGLLLAALGTLLLLMGLDLITGGLLTRAVTGGGSRPGPGPGPADNEDDSDDSDGGDEGDGTGGPDSDSDSD